MRYVDYAVGSLFPSLEMASEHWARAWGLCNQRYQGRDGTTVSPTHSILSSTTVLLRLGMRFLPCPRRPFSPSALRAYYIATSSLEINGFQPNPRCSQGTLANQGATFVMLRLRGKPKFDFAFIRLIRLMHRLISLWFKTLEILWTALALVFVFPLSYSFIL